MPLAAGTTSVGASLGTAVSGVDGVDFPTLLHAADLRMYAHKQLGRDAAPARLAAPTV